MTVEAPMALLKQGICDFGWKASPHFSHSMGPAPVQEADRAEAARSAMWAHRASAATHPVCFFNRPFGLPFGGHLRRRKRNAGHMECEKCGLRISP
jgi:hypothetical protein